MILRACKNCLFFVKHYGTKDKQGHRTVSNYWCVSRNGFITKPPKECERRKEKQG